MQHQETRLLCIEGKRWQVTVESRLKYLEEARGDSDAMHRQEPLLIEVLSFRASCGGGTACPTEAPPIYTCYIYIYIYTIDTYIPMQEFQLQIAVELLHRGLF